MTGGDDARAFCGTGTRTRATLSAIAPQQIKKNLDARPFIPFRLHLSDGTAYDVSDPADAYVDMLFVTVGTDPDAENGLFRKSIQISPNHVGRIEPMPELKAS